MVYFSTCIQALRDLNTPPQVKHDLCLYLFQRYFRINEDFLHQAKSL